MLGRTHRRVVQPFQEGRGIEVRIKDFYTVTEIAAAFGVTRAAVQAWIDKGLIYAGFYENKHWISRDEYLRFKRIEWPKPQHHQKEAISNGKTKGAKERTDKAAVL